MKLYAIVDAVTGRVLQTCGCGDIEEARDICALNQYPIEVSEVIRDDLFYIYDGALVPYPPRPSSVHTFNWTSKEWEDGRTLRQLKDAKWSEIKQARESAEFAGFLWDGSVFDSDALSQSRIQGAVQLAGIKSDFVIEWTLKDNNVRILNGSDMVNVGVALGLHVATQHTKARGLRVQIETSTSAAAIDAVVWLA